ncbi:DUF4262 domain-containing protein [Amycolatopsis sp. NPDC051903]|uniref:DUF4262 domain-containing protein n=1 Tax=Amycolatopsis sp. NPDC051903 TaxID=3363936 RepID=UPI0037AA54B8
MPTDAACRCLVCAGYGDRDHLDTVDTGLVAHVADPGWGLLAIPADEVSAGWTFTVGLWHSFRTPELAVFGLDPKPGLALLNAIGEQVGAGLRVAAGDRLAGFLRSGATLEVRQVDEGWHEAFFGTARGFYRATRPAVPFLQVVWPDRDGRFPAQDGFAVELEPCQPWLWLAPAEHPRGPWTAVL